MMSVRKSLAAFAVVAGACFGPTGAHAGEMFSFQCLTVNTEQNCAIGADQLTLEVKAGSAAGTIDFVFRNTGPLPSSIADIYFDWLNPSDAYAPGAITNGSGVSFSWGASPSNLPGGNNLSTAFTADLGADSNAPTQPNGVNPNEWVIFTFAADLATAIADIYSGDLRVGLHVQGFAGGGSESFVTPEPGTLAVLGLGLVALAGLTRRRA